jgi:hypothetical protein
MQKLAIAPNITRYPAANQVIVKVLLKRSPVRLKPFIGLTADHADAIHFFLG